MTLPSSAALTRLRLRVSNRVVAFAAGIRKKQGVYSRFEEWLDLLRKSGLRVVVREINSHGQLCCGEEKSCGEHLVGLQVDVE